MILAAACLLPVLQSSQKVDFEVRATTLSNALGKLSRQVDRQYVPSQELAGEVVCINVHGVPLSELESRLAATVDAEWIADRGTKRLSRTPQRISELKNIEFEARKKWLETLFGQKAKELARLKNPNDQAEGFLKAMKDLEEKGRRQYRAQPRRPAIGSAIQHPCECSDNRFGSRCGRCAPIR